MVPKEVLRVIRDEPRLTPIEIAERVKRDVGWIRNVLVTMRELQLVESPARGVYIITKQGEYVLEQMEVEDTNGSRRTIETDWG